MNTYSITVLISDGEPLAMETMRCIHAQSLFEAEQKATDVARTWFGKPGEFHNGWYFHEKQGLSVKIKEVSQTNATEFLQAHMVKAA
ncbi:MAG: hypothetical protein HQK83_11755 [Fibrobacteria bacterium]|nr:hypothetical protein [Fibrobacteria bacterium]